MRRGRRRDVAVGFGLAAALGACGEVKLVDPLATDVDVQGAVFEVTVRERPTGASVVFVGYAYGYDRRGGAVYVRLLDAGAVAVAGRRAERRFLRVGEPEYVLRTTLRAPPPAVPVRITGSPSVPSCELDLPVPVAELPTGGALVRRSDDLAIPLPTLPDALPPTERITAHVELVGRDGPPRRAEVEPFQAPGGPVLVVPAGFLRGLPAGPAELSVEVDWRRSNETAGSGPGCAPALITTTTFRAERGIRLE